MRKARSVRQPRAGSAVGKDTEIQRRRDTGVAKRQHSRWRLEASSVEGCGDAVHRERKEEILEGWARAVGIEHSKWQIGSTRGGPRGAIAIDDIAAGEVLVSMPKSKCFITYEGDACPFRASFLAPAVWDQELREEWNVKLSLMLLHEQRLGHASAWAPYIASLPPSFLTARNMQNEQLQALQDGTMLLRVRASASGGMPMSGSSDAGRRPPPPQQEGSGGVNAMGGEGGGVVDRGEWQELERVRMTAEAVWGGGQGGAVAVWEDGMDQEAWEEKMWAVLCRYAEYEDLSYSCMRP
jgi:hypothetical protein